MKKLNQKNNYQGTVSTLIKYRSVFFRGCAVLFSVLMGAEIF